MSTRRTCTRTRFRSPQIAGAADIAVVEEIPEGSWAQTGQIRRLPEVAAIAQFEHLAPIEMQR
jgi:hypothetical protein